VNSVIISQIGQGHRHFYCIGKEGVVLCRANIDKGKHYFLECG